MSFEKWLRTPVYVDNCLIKRGDWIKTFVKYGLYPWVISKGYRWAISVNHLKNCIATGLYQNAGRSFLDSKWDYQIHNIDYKNNEDREHFYHVLSFEEWENFWEIWGNMDDIDDEMFRGQDRRFDIQDFIWEQVDLANSPQTQVLNQYLSDYPDSDDDYRSNNVDSYVQEYYDKTSASKLNR
jgi:hypothetical protein